MGKLVRRINKEGKYQLAIQGRKTLRIIGEFDTEEELRQAGDNYLRSKGIDPPPYTSLWKPAPPELIKKAFSPLSICSTTVEGAIKRMDRENGIKNDESGE